MKYTVKINQAHVAKIAETLNPQHVDKIARLYIDMMNSDDAHEGAAIAAYNAEMTIIEQKYGLDASRLYMAVAIAAYDATQY